MNNCALKITVDQLAVSSYIQDVLLRNGIVTVEDLVNLKYQDLLKIKKLSLESISKISDCIRELMSLSEKHTKLKLTADHYRQLLEIKNGADIIGHYEAKLLREVEEVKPEFIKICEPMGRYSVKEELPFFGAITTIKGVKFSEEFLRIPRHDTDLLEMELSTRTINTLHSYGVYSLDDVITYTRKDLLKLKGMGSKSVREVVECLENFGLELSGGNNK